MEISKDAQAKISRLQMMEQNMQQLHAQKQAFQTELFELESAIKEIGTATKAYKIIANVMVEGKKDVLEQDLKQKKEVVELRVKSIEKQEEQLKSKAKEIQEEVMKELK